MNRDPVEERGGENLYGFLENIPASRIDILGLSWWGLPGGIPVSQSSIQVSNDDSSDEHECRFWYVSNDLRRKDDWFRVLTRYTLIVDVFGYSPVTGGYENAPLFTVHWGTSWALSRRGQRNLQREKICKAIYVCRVTCDSDCCGKRRRTVFEKNVIGLTRFVRRRRWGPDILDCIPYTVHLHNVELECDHKARDACSTN